MLSSWWRQGMALPPRLLATFTPGSQPRSAVGRIEYKPPSIPLKTVTWTIGKSSTPARSLVEGFESSTFNLPIVNPPRRRACRERSRRAAARLPPARQKKIRVSPRSLVCEVEVSASRIIGLSSNQFISLSLAKTPSIRQDFDLEKSTPGNPEF